ncbi:AAA family ATPase [Rhodobium gokarnense]|uniref:Pilus assembly protein CpaE n=1 Tax=Rhodobium gokarnense TaxID=364296 RepID=A0ABT3H813_9HYPH|nr:CpaE family protein [Rhodobium gokarnense]MCW2306518.1 pilus assembly protein CpaE [Rhodobium gokarnense]
MSSLAYESGQDPAEQAPTLNRDARPVPRISIQAFCETPEVAHTIEQAASDRRMMKAHVKVHMGGIDSAVEFYQSAPTPNLVVVESQLPREALFGQLDSLADVCDTGTRVVLIGHINDVVLYRDLIRKGVSEYIIAPIDVFDFVAMVGDLYNSEDAEPLGRSIAFIGAKGGCGSSTVAHNVAWSIARAYQNDVILADLDLPFGTAGLDFNQDPIQGIAEAVASPDRVDDVFIDRLLSKCTEHLSLLAAPATLDRTYDFDEKIFDNIVDVLRSGVPTVVLDVPHIWTSWSRRVLSIADEIVITALPDLANLRNVKNICDYLQSVRANDGPPHLVLNQVGTPKRPEIRTEEFVRALSIKPIAEIPFDGQLFGAAANNGQMIGEADPKNAATETFHFIGQVVTGRTEARKQKRSALAPILSRLRGKKD